jgi:hypothetical protein
MNIAQLLAKSARAFPERPALTVGTQVVSSYAACAETASRIAGFLRGSLNQPNQHFRQSADEIARRAHASEAVGCHRQNQGRRI